MKITLLQVGKTKQSYWQQAEQEYLKRLQPYSKINVITLSEVPLPKGSSVAGREQVKKKEALAILENIPKASFVIALDEHGKEYTSLEFAQFLQKQRDFENANLTFIIGGCYGLDSTVLKKANMTLAFSRLTFTHEMIRTLLLEQLYRGFSILANKTYHY